MLSKPEYDKKILKIINFYDAFHLKDSNKFKFYSWLYTSSEFQQSTAMALERLIDVVEKLDKINDPRREAAELVMHAVNFADESLLNHTYSKNVHDAVIQTLNDAAECLTATNNTQILAPFNSLKKLQAAVQEPYLKRKQKTLLYKFLGALAIVLGLALIAASLAFAPVITLPGVVAGCLLGGLLVTFGADDLMNRFFLKEEKIPLEEEKRMTEFENSVKVLVKAKSPALFAEHSKTDGDIGKSNSNAQVSGLAI